MYYDVTAIKYIEGYKFEVVFGNGEKGIVDFQRYVEKGRVFSRFSDMEYFKHIHGVDSAEAV